MTSITTDSLTTPFKIYRYLTVYLLENALIINNKPVKYSGKDSNGRHIFISKHLNLLVKQYESRLQKALEANNLQNVKLGKFQSICYNDISVKLTSDNITFTPSNNRLNNQSQIYKLSFKIKGIWLNNSTIYGPFIQNIEIN